MTCTTLWLRLPLTLAKPEGGVVTLIVPLSICFGQDQKDTRQLFESDCDRIVLRNQDNRPDKAFHNSPIQNAESRQRTTMLTARTGKGQPEVELSGTNRWLRSERYDYLRSRETPLPRTKTLSVSSKLDNQWERVPTQEIQDLIGKMKECTQRIINLRVPGDNYCKLGIPFTAMYFITTTPAGNLKRGENQLDISSTEHLELAMAAVNGHAAYAWWRAYGDAFHVNPYEVETIPLPDLWVQDPATNSEARKLGRELMDAINPDNIRTNITGTNSIEQDSLNFHKSATDTIESIDKLYLKSLGLNEKPLLSQLQVFRNDSTWRLGMV